MRRQLECAASVGDDAVRADGEVASGPAPCTGQSTTSLFASTPAAALQSKAKALCIPAFDGFGGTMEYPPARPSITAALTASTTNYNQQLPALGKKGKPIYYLQVADLGRQYRVRKIVRASGGLSSAKAHRRKIVYALR